MAIHPRSSIQNINNRGWGFGKAKVLLKLINNQPDLDPIYLYAKDPYEAKYQLLINKRKRTGLEHFDDPEAFIKYSNDIQDVYKILMNTI